MLLQHKLHELYQFLPVQIDKFKNSLATHREEDFLKRQLVSICLSDSSHSKWHGYLKNAWIFVFSPAILTRLIEKCYASVATRFEGTWSSSETASSSDKNPRCIWNCLPKESNAFTKLDVLNWMLLLSLDVVSSFTCDTLQANIQISLNYMLMIAK